MPLEVPASKLALGSKPSPSRGQPCSASSCVPRYSVLVVLLASNTRLHADEEAFSAERQAPGAAEVSLIQKARGE